MLKAIYRKLRSEGAGLVVESVDGLHGEDSSGKSPCARLEQQPMQAEKK